MQTNKITVIIRNILLSMLSFVVDIAPIGITALIAAICNIDVSTLINDDFVMSGNLLWLGCAYMGFMLIGIFTNMDTRDKKAKILLGINIFGIFAGVIVYTLNKLLYFSLLKNANKDVMVQFIWITFVFLFAFYLAYIVISNIYKVKAIKQDQIGDQLC